MKVSDIMLDLATGDASVHDAYIQEAMGQVKVSAALFDAAKQIATAKDGEIDSVVQESVTAAGLPVDKEGALELVYESVEHEILGLSRQFYTEMAKIDERATKPTTPYAAMNAMARGLGCEMKLDGSLEYAMEYAKAVSEGKKETKLKSGTRHLKGKAAEKQTGNLIQGACILANALGIDTKSFLESKSIKAVVPGGLSTSAGKDEDGKTCCSLNFCVKTIASADKFIKKATFKESDFTTSPTPDDIAKVHACDTAVSKLASFIKSKFGEDGAKIEARVKKACASCNKKKISDAAEELNEKNDANVSKVVEVAKHLRAACDDFIKEFNNSADALITTKNEE